MGLRIAVPVFHVGILKFVMRQLHSVHGLDYEDMLDRLTRYCMEGRLTSHPQFAEIFLHCMALWDSGDNATSVPESITENQFGQGHYLALMKCVLSDMGSAEGLIDELSEVLAGDLQGKRSVAYAEWVEYQKLLITAMSHASRHNNKPVRTKFTASHLAEYGEVDFVDDDGSFRHIAIRPDYISSTPDDFITRIFFGGIDTLRMFGAEKLNQ